MPRGQTNCNSCGELLTDAELAADGFGPAGTLLCEGCKRAAARQRRNGWAPAMQWESDGDGLRLASKAHVPWTDRNVVMISISKAGVVRTAHTAGGKRDLITEALFSDMILVAWPGARRQDVFIVDDRQAARRALK